MKVLNVGGNNKSIPIPQYFNGWEHHLLDIDAGCMPDICCDAMLLKNKEEYNGIYDAVYCSHNLEHYYKHKVPEVLNGFYNVLNDNGFCYIAVPNIMNVLRILIAYNMDLTDTIYEIDAGSISTHDVMFGWGKQVEESGFEYFAHKCAFTPKMLGNVCIKAGFPFTYLSEKNLELKAFAFKQKPDEEKLKKIMN